MIIKSIPIAKINPAPYNPRRDLKPEDPEYLQLQKSVRTFGLVEPLVWNRRTGNLVAGHQRHKVLRAAGGTHVDVSVVDLSPAKEKALNLALNRIRGDWDHEKLATLLDEPSRVPEWIIATARFRITVKRIAANLRFRRLEGYTL